MKKGFLLLVIFLSIVMANPDSAHSKVIQSIGLGAGMCLPQGGWDPGFSFTAQANMGEAIKYLYFSPYLSYANAGKSQEFNGQIENLSIQYFALGAKMVGYINSKPQGFYLGGSISYNLINSDDLKWGELTENTHITNQNTTKIGFTGLAGYLFMLKKISIFLEADYMFTEGGFNNLSILTGVSLNL